MKKPKMLPLETEKQIIQAINQGKVWFYYYDGLDFMGFSRNGAKKGERNGPFRTLKEAKADAIDFFDFYVWRGQQAKAEIRKWKEKK